MQSSRIGAHQRHSSQSGRPRLTPFAPLPTRQGLRYDKCMVVHLNTRTLVGTLLGGSLISLPGQAFAGRASKDLDTAPATRIYGGEIAKPCEFPTTLYASGCTAVLVHPQVVLSAGHCGKLRALDFGEYASKKAKRVGVKWCETTSFSSTDAQICVLKEPMTGLPTAPVIQGCEVEALKAKAEVYLAGFGLDENDPAGGGGVDEKRWVQTSINSVSEATLSVGGGGKGGCQGDSGGPVYIKLSDGTWRTIGITHGGGSHPNCDAGYYKRTDKIIGWYEEQLKKHGETDIDLTPCFNDDGEWEATEACGGYTKEVQGPYGEWSNNCGEGMPVQKYSATCGEPFGPNDDEDSSEESEQDSDNKDKELPKDEKNKSQAPKDSQGDASSDDASKEQDGDADPESSSEDSDQNAEPSEKSDKRSGCAIDAAPPFPLALLLGAAWLSRRRRRGSRPKFQKCGE